MAGCPNASTFDGGCVRRSGPVPRYTLICRLCATPARSKGKPHGTALGLWIRRYFPSLWEVTQGGGVLFWKASFAGPEGLDVVQV